MSAGNRARIVRAIHSYARARAAADFTLGDRSVSESDFRSRVEAVQRADERLMGLVEAELPMTLAARGTVRLIAEFAVQIETYIINRRAGKGVDAAQDAIAALDRILEAAERAA